MSKHLPPPPMPNTYIDSGTTEPDIRYEPESPEERKDRREVLMAVILVMILLMVGAIGASEVSRIQRSQQNTPILERIQEQTAIIKDTVDPGGERFQRAQRSTTASIGSINEITVLAAYCAKTNTELPMIQACVQSEYLKLHPSAR